ncbi:MAG: 50S ribosomal protein L11 methyltransferase [Candidatus Accumulibacter sp.]|nr:50S ribosomal protein L11 methyltransferase [Accumulibacter sp.]
MAWHSLTLTTDSAHAEALADALLEAGALSVQIDDADAGTEKEAPQFDEPGAPTVLAWENSRVTALFEPGQKLADVAAECAARARIGGKPALIEEEVSEQDWVRLTQSQFDPIRISDRLWVVPSWHEAPDPGVLVLRLDPGMAFGTGSHPTTRLCLEWLERHVEPGDSVLDYGCGSGILAIAAAKLGGNALLGVDIDPQAVAAARYNAERNRVDVRFEDTSVKIERRFDIVLANILTNTLKALAPEICARVRPGGRLLLSGILETQTDDVVSSYAPNGVSLTRAAASEGWVCLAGMKAGA